MNTSSQKEFRLSDLHASAAPAIGRWRVEITLMLMLVLSD
jgi:hypothetical protein